MLISGLGNAAEIFVNQGSSIQTAVNNAASGDIITVKPGTYTENLQVSKDNLTIRSESGNPDDTIIKAKNTGTHVFFLQGNNIKISGFKILGASKSSSAGVNLSSCSNCIIQNNKILDNSRGIYLLRSRGNTVSKNSVTNCGEYGIALQGSTGITVSENTAQDNQRGIYLGTADDNIISSNTVQSNSVYGLFICGLSDRNHVYNNYFNNVNMTIRNGSRNSYNTTKTAGTNIIGGPYIGGNFWGKPDGTGFSQTAVDKDGDGISDSPYNNITDSIYSDYLPLTTPGSILTIPVADFSSNVTSGTAPLSVRFTDNSTGAPTSWNWNFGDGNTSKDRSPVHTYYLTGNYTVNLTVSNANGSNSKLATITVSARPVSVLPVAKFTSNVSSGNAPLSVQFYDSSLNATGWKWDFGDGKNSTVRNPINIYSKAGNYTVNLTVSNANGTNSTFGKIVVLDKPVPVLPVANFSANVTEGFAPLAVQFTDSSKNATSVNWNFGDGTTSTEKNPIHTYSEAGIYTVNLTANNENGTSSKLATITVSEKPVPVLPVANFSANKTEGFAPLSVQFQDLSENADSTNWDFGDGSTSTEKTPVHEFTVPGTYTVNLTASNENGTDSKLATITVSEKPVPVLPVANFSANTTEGFAPLMVQFTDSSENADSLNWNFGDGSTSTERNPVHEYSNPGLYTVNLTASNGNGSASKLATIKVLEKPVPILPVANFSANTTEGFAPLSVKFTDSSENADSVNWNFGDGAISAEKNPVHEFTIPGTYTVNLTASNENGTDSKLATITVSEKPVPVLPIANFTSNVSEGSAPLMVQFTDLSENADSLNWNFGDGSTSTEKTPVHEFTVPGTYTVNLTASNENGTDSKLATITVSEKPAPVLPVADFSANTTEGFAPLMVQFTDSSENADSLNWNFGDGSTSTEKNPIHEFTVPGTYAVNLTASNENGTSSKLATITVSEKPVPVLPIANFTSNVSEGSSPLMVQFTDSSENAVSVKWDFGDGSNSEERSPVHEYLNPGIYTVNLTASNENGTDSKLATITVLEKPVPVLPVANFSANTTEGFAPLSIQFKDLSENAVSVKWDFGDGATSTEKNPVHEFTVTGTYTVNLTASNENGTDSKLATIKVYEKPEPVYPVANFSSNVSEGFAPLSVKFTDLSENADSVNWNFGDGSNSEERSPVHEYSNPGIYTVNLTVSNENGTASKLATITVSEKPLPILPEANFSTNTTEGSAPLTVQFTDSSENADSLNWNFGDGSTSTEKNPIHEFTVPGTYTVNLTASNENGTDSKLATITVSEKPLPILPVANFSANATEGFAPLTVQFTDSSENATYVNWNLGDEAISTEKNLIHTYSEAGIYTVNLTASNENGTSSKLTTITVSEKPVPVLPIANFTSNVSEGSAPLMVQFTDSSENAVSVKWDFGDGNNSEERSPVHEYLNPGIYTINLTASNENGTDSKLATITVLEKPVPILPVANFSANTTEGFSPLSVQFTDSSENADTVNWNFGDGTTSTEKNPIHEFTVPGTYTVNLTASNENGTDSKLVTITVLEKPVPILPVANFSANTTEGFSPLSVQFTDSSENADSVNWNFGDGTTSTEKNPIHEFTVPGTYTVNLTASNENGTNSKLATITVSVKSTPTTPVANFTSNVSQGSAPLSVQFTDLSENAASVKWDFGDGATSTEKNPIHTYLRAGTYTVNLTVSNENGSASKLATITVSEKAVPVLPVANFVTNTSNGFAPLSVQFTDLSKNATSVKWSFGDGAVSTEKNPVHTYLRAGVYKVNLKASNENGSASKIAIITVSKKAPPILPVAKFITNTTNGFAPLSVQFKDVSFKATGRIWDFGDGITSTEANPIHTYTTAGKYTVLLSVSNADGNDTESKVIIVTAKPVKSSLKAVFTATPLAGRAPLTVKFTDKSVNATSIKWDFGDNSTISTESKPVHTYNNTGVYHVNLTAINGEKSDVATKTVVVSKPRK